MFVCLVLLCGGVCLFVLYFGFALGWVLCWVRLVVLFGGLGYLWWLCIVWVCVVVWLFCLLFCLWVCLYLVELFGFGGCGLFVFDVWWFYCLCLVLYLVVLRLVCWWFLRFVCLAVRCFSLDACWFCLLVWWFDGD